MIIADNSKIYATFKYEITINLLIINYKSVCKRLYELRFVSFCLLVFNKFIQNKLNFRKSRIKNPRHRVRNPRHLESWKAAIEKYSLQEYINISDSNPPQGLYQKYSIPFIPTSFLINKEGIIIGRYEGLQTDQVLKDIYTTISN